MTADAGLVQQLRAHPVATVVAAALAAAALSLLSGTALAYDPTSWEVWARELTHGSLNTAVAAPAWKPLPVFVDAAFMPFGAAFAAGAWLVTIRAATVVGVVTAAAIGGRLAGRAGAAGAAGVVSFVLLGRFGPLVAAGVSEPLCAAAVLVAVWAALSGRPRVLLPALLVAALLRPEAWPLLATAAAVVAWRCRGRPLILVASLGSLVVVAAAWFLPDWVSTGDPLRSLHQDAAAVTGGPLHTTHPVLTVVGEVWSTLPMAAWVAVVLAGTVLARRRSRGGAIIGIAAVEWVGVELTAVARHTSSGDARYLAPGLVLVAVLAGVAPGLVGRWMRARGWTPPVVAATAAVGAVVLIAPAAPAAARTGAAGWEWQRAQTHAATELDGLTDSPGWATLAHCGPLTTGPYQVPVVAWVADLPLQDVHEFGRRGGVAVLETSAHVQPVRGYREVARFSASGHQWTTWVPRRCR